MWSPSFRRTINLSNGFKSNWRSKLMNPLALLPTGVYRARVSRLCWCALNTPLHPYPLHFCVGGIFLWHYPRDRSHWALPSSLIFMEARTFLKIYTQNKFWNKFRNCTLTLPYTYYVLQRLETRSKIDGQNFLWCLVESCSKILAFF